MDRYKARFRNFRHECVLARSYNIAAEMVSLSELPRNPLLDSILPSLLHLKAVAILDEVLSAEIDSRGIKLPNRSYRANLHGRISALADSGYLPEADELHQVRSRRNDVAHEHESYVTWTELDADLDTVEKAFVRLGVADKSLPCEVHAERLPCDHPDKAGVLFAFDYRIDVMEAGKPVLSYSWRSEVLDDDGPLAPA